MANIPNPRPLRLGILVPPFIGHLRPATVLSRALDSRGHRVEILSFADAAGPLASSGVELTVFGEAEFPAGEWDRRVAIYAWRRRGT